MDFLSTLLAAFLALLPGQAEPVSDLIVPVSKPAQTEETQNLGQGIQTLDPWKLVTSVDGTYITQRQANRPVSFSGLNPGECVEIALNGFATTTGDPCGSGGGGGLTGSTGQIPYFSGTNTAVGTSTIFLTSTGVLGIGTTTTSGFSSGINMGINKNLVLTSNQDTDNFRGNIQFFNTTTTTKTGLEWYDNEGDSIAWLVAHDTNPLGVPGDHHHIEIETADLSGHKQGRFTVGYDCDYDCLATFNQTEVQINRNSGQTNGNLLFNGGGQLRNTGVMQIIPNNALNTKGFRIATSTDGDIAIDVTSGTELEIADAIRVSGSATVVGAGTFNNNDGVDNETMLTVGDSNDLDNLLVYGNAGIGGNITATGTLAVAGATTLSTLTTSSNIEVDGTGNAFMILDRNANTNFAAFQFQTNNSTFATVGGYNNGTNNFHFNMDAATAGKRDVLKFVVDTEAVFNDGGGDLDFRVEGDTNQELIVANAGLDRVGIGTSTPSSKFTVVGNAQIDNGNLIISDEGSGSSRYTFDQDADEILTLQRSGGSDQNYSLLRVKAPAAAPNEATLALLTDEGGGNYTIFDVYQQEYSNERQWGLRQINAGTHQATPFVIDFARSGVKVPQFVILPSGQIGFGVATSSIPAGVGFYVATTTANSVFNGNVGIGTTSPLAKLSVTNTGSGPSFVVEDSTSPDISPFIIDASGNVGIGTTSPTGKLAVDGDLTVTGNFNVGGVSILNGDILFPADQYINVGDTLLYFNSTFGNFAFLNTRSGGGIQFQADGYVQFQRSSDFTSLFSIYPSGGTIELFDGFGNETPGVFRINGWNTAASARRYTQFQQTTNGYLNFTGQDANVKGTTFNTGDVGIATSTPEARLDVWGASGGKILTLFSNTGTKFLEMLNTGVTTLRGTWDFSNATVKQHVYKTVSWPSGTGMATTTSATTTLWLGPRIITETWNTARCASNAVSSVGFRVTDGTNHMNFGLSTTTAASTTLSTNNVLTGGVDNAYLEVGPMTNGNISCTFDITQN
jgi:hypothetical protein